MDIVYEDAEPSITLNGLAPQDETWAIKTFTVTGTNTTELVMPYTINLVINNNTFSNNALTYDLTGLGIGAVESSVGNISGTLNIPIGTGSFNPGEDIVHSYTLKIFFPETGINQSADKGKSTSLHIGIEGGTSKPVELPSKGDFITMNVGEGLPNLYRVLNLDGYDLTSGVRPALVINLSKINFEIVDNIS